MISITLSAATALLFTFAQEAPPAPDFHPSTPEEWCAHFEVSKVYHHAWEGMELWSDDKKTFQALQPALDAAWTSGMELLGGNPLPADRTIRVVAGAGEEMLTDYWPLLIEGAQRSGVEAPPQFLLSGATGKGSSHWNLPPTILLNSKVEGLSVLPTRAVHEVAVLLAGWSSSWSGYGTPEFLEEGLAGMIERRAIKKPAALVYHDKAALTVTIHGYGVFSGIGEALNDSSNSPNNWPRLIHNALGKMVKEQKSKSKRKKASADQRIDRLLLRSHEDFARADYAYAWAVMEFLFDHPIPAEELASQAEEASAHAVTPNEKDATSTDGAEAEATEELRPATNREIFHRVLEEMRATQHASLDQAGRSQLLLDLVLKHKGVTGEELHLEFLDWALESLPKK